MEHPRNFLVIPSLFLNFPEDADEGEEEPEVIQDPSNQNQGIVIVPSLNGGSSTTDQNTGMMGACMWGGVGWWRGMWVVSGFSYMQQSIIRVL